MEDGGNFGRSDINLKKHHATRRHMYKKSAFKKEIACIAFLL